MIAVLLIKGGDFYISTMENAIDPQEEKRIAQQAEKILRDALRSKISSLNFKNHVSGPKLKLSDADASAKINLGKISADNSNLKYYMNSLSMQMGKHGFIQHYGASTVREDIKGRTRQKPKTTHYNFKNHVYNLPAKNFIDQAIQQSGVIPYVLQRITETRSKEIFIQLKNFMEKE